MPLQALVGLMAVEAGHVGGVNPNTNGTDDLGVMQINTTWVGRLERFHWTAYRLTYNGCLNVLAGAWILKYYWDREGGGPATIWKAIGDYHSHSEALALRYENQVYRQLSAQATLAYEVQHANEWFWHPSATDLASPGVARVARDARRMRDAGPGSD